jgi:signal transduction histidine kinase
LERSIELIQHELVSHQVNFEFLPAPDLPIILASEDHLQSVWINLIMNAIDSMNKNPAQICLTTCRLEETIQISISDNGKGILPEKLSNIFEPFYTTKIAGKGTGLGLSISHRIVKQHGGSIQVKSQPGIGSEFTVVLPIISTGFPYE